MKTKFLILVVSTIFLLVGNAYALITEQLPASRDHYAEAIHMILFGVGLFLLAQIIRNRNNIKWLRIAGLK